MVRVLGLGFCVRVRVSVTGSVSYLNKKFVVVLAVVVISVDQNVLPGGDRSRYYSPPGYLDAIHDELIMRALTHSVGDFGA